jgi:diketogulonate reductase-like aldo/keto reductase
MSAMERLVETGKIRFIGVSNFTLSELRRAQSVLSKARIVSNQVRYNLLDRLPEEGLLQYCDSNKISLLAYSPLDTGFDHLRSADPGDILGRVATSTGKTRAQVALSWCISHPAVITIFKADKVEHIRENCAASGAELSIEHRQLLDAGIRHSGRSRPERFVRGFARRALQYAGRNLGNPTAMDEDQSLRTSPQQVAQKR